jgi:hypothetical protein
MRLHAKVWDPHRRRCSSCSSPISRRVCCSQITVASACQTRWLGLRWAHTCNVTAYCNTVPWQCGRDWWPRNVSKVGYAVKLRPCSVRCRYLAVASKGWHGYGLSRSGRATWHVTTVRSSRLLAPVTNWEPHGVTLAGYCYVMRHGMKVQTVTPYRVSHWQRTALRYGVTVQGVPSLRLRT